MPKNKSFVIVVDAQYDFMHPKGKLSVEDAYDLVNPTEKWLYGLDRNEVAGVLFTLDTHFAETYPASEEAKQFNPHCYKGTEGWELLVRPSKTASLIPKFSMEKNVFDMWSQTNLTVKPIDIRNMYDDIEHWDREEFFRFLRTTLHVNTIIVCGVTSDYCVKFAIKGALDRNFEVIVKRNLVKGIFKEIDQVVEEDFPDKNITIV